MKLPRLHDIRERKTMTIRELATEAKVSPATIVRIEHDGDAALRTVRALATALGVEVEELAGD